MQNEESADAASVLDPHFSPAKIFNKMDVKLDPNTANTSPMYTTSIIETEYVAEQGLKAD